jgi:hypothetical protein
MTHSKCVTCTARVWREGEAADHLDDLCPGCGGPLAPVADLSELVGFRALRVRPRSRRGDPSQRVADRIRETIARHDAERGRHGSPS